MSKLDIDLGEANVMDKSCWMARYSLGNILLVLYIGTVSFSELHSFVVPSIRSVSCE